MGNARRRLTLAPFFGRHRGDEAVLPRSYESDAAPRSVTACLNKAHGASVERPFAPKLCSERCGEAPPVRRPKATILRGPHEPSTPGAEHPERGAIEWSSAFEHSRTIERARLEAQDTMWAQHPHGNFRTTTQVSPPAPLGAVCSRWSYRLLRRRLSWSSICRGAMNRAPSNCRHAALPPKSPERARTLGLGTEISRPPEHTDRTPGLGP